MNLRGHLQWVLAVLLAVFVVTLLSPQNVEATEDDGGTSNDWGGSGLQTGVWVPIPGEGGYWGQPPGAVEDPYTYTHKTACAVGDGALFAECASALPVCNAAKDGIAVYWYRSLKAINPPKWEFLSGPTCIYSEKPRDILAEIAADIVRQFRESPVKPASVASQPGPHALRGDQTNFYALADEQAFTLAMLGQKVHIVATPVSYTWNYGDGTVIGPTPSAGAPLPDDRWGEQTPTSHAYAATGNYQIVVTTHFHGTYAVNGGPALPIPEEGAFDSAPLTLRVWRAVTKNYADNCLVNPQGVGC